MTHVFAIKHGQFVRVLWVVIEMEAQQNQNKGGIESHYSICSVAHRFDNNKVFKIY